MRELADTGPRTALEARDAQLVDRLGYRDEAYAAMRARVGAEAELLFADRWRPPRRPHLPGRRKGHVALVEVRGAIVSGRLRRTPMGRQVGSDSVGAALRAATQDEHVRAVVVHVDSPGGSAVASDTIWREVCRVRDAGKPSGCVARVGAPAPPHPPRFHFLHAAPGPDRRGRRLWAEPPVPAQVPWMQLHRCPIVLPLPQHAHSLVQPIDSWLAQHNRHTLIKHHRPVRLAQRAKRV